MPSIRQQKETSIQALSPKGSDLAFLNIQSNEAIRFFPRGLNRPLQLVISILSVGFPTAHSIDKTRHPEWAILFKNSPRKLTS